MSRSDAAFKMVAGEHPETARVDRKRLVKAELGGEIRDRSEAERPRILAAPRFVVLEVVPERVVRASDARPQSEDLGSFFEIVVGQTVEKRERVAAQLPPELRDPGPGRCGRPRNARSSRGCGPARSICGVFPRCSPVSCASRSGAGGASRTPIPLRRSTNSNRSPETPHRGSPRHGSRTSRLQKVCSDSWCHPRAARQCPPDTRNDRRAA